MSKYDKEREKLGLSKVGSASSVSTKSDSGKSKYALERAALSDPSLKRAAENQQYSNAMKSSRLMEIDNLKAQQEKERTEKELIKANDVNWKSWAVPTASGDPLSLGLGPINQEKYKSQVDLMNRNGTIGPADPKSFALDDVMLAFQKNDAEAKKRLAESRFSELPQEVQTDWRNMALERSSELSRLNSDSRIATNLRQFADATKPIADIGMTLYTPGAGLNVLQGATIGAEALVAKAAPKLAGSALGRVGQVAASEALVGAPTAVGQTLTQNPEASGREILTSAGLGAGGGALLGGLGKTIGEGIRGLRGSADNIASEPVQGVTRAANNEGIQLPNSGRRTVARDAEALTDPQKIKVPFFMRLFGEENLGFTPFGSKKSGRMVSTEQQIVSNPLKSNISGAIDTAKQAARSTYQNTVDYLSPLKTINRKTYETAMDASRANNIANTIIRDKFVDLEGNVIGNSLDEIMKNTRGLGKKVDDYLVLRHAVTRLGRGERVYDDALNMTADKAAQQVADLEKRYPQLAEVGKMWDEFNTNLLDSGVREGLISQAARDAMREANPNYAAMRRQFSLGEKMAQPKWGGNGSSFSGQKAPIKEVSPTGSTRKIVSPLRSAIEQVYAWKNAELRNRTMQEIVNAIQLDPQGMEGIATIVKKPTTSYKNLDDALREGGSEEFLELLDNDFKSLFKKSGTGEENIVRAMVNGNPVYVQVHNPEAVKALLGLGNEQSGFVLKAMQTLSNATKRGATGLLAPMFAVKSVTADTVQAMIQSPNALKHIAVDLPHAIISALVETIPASIGSKVPGIKSLRKLAEDFRRSGGEYSALLRGDRKLNTAVGSLRRDPFLSPQGVAKGVKASIKAPFKVLEKVSDISENANRMAAFRRAMAGKERTPENVRKAINAAREATTNYSRKGALANQTEAFIPYSNAAVQGIYRMGKAFVKNPVKTIAGLGTLVIAPKLYEYAKFNDDPDYQNIPARVRYRNIIIGKNSDGTFNMLPMPPEYEAFGAFLTDVLNDVVNNDPEAFKGSSDALVNAFTPPIVSGLAQGLTQGGGFEQSLKGGINATVAAPAVAIAGNQSFTGAPIVPKRLEGNSAEFQYDERTSEPAKWLGKKLGMAPLKVDYLLRSYGGDPARLVLPLTSDAGGGTPRNTLLKNFIVDPVFTNNLSNDYYTAKDAFTQAKNDFEDFGKPLPAWYTEEGYKLINSQAKGSASKKLTALNAEKRTINGSTLMNRFQKAEKLRELQAKINDIYADVNSQLLKNGFKFPNR